MSSLTSIIVAVIVGGVVGGASLVGLVASQTGAPDNSPADAAHVAVPYGNN